VTRKKTKRKVWPLIDPIEHAAYQASTLSVAEWNRQMTPIIAAVDLLRQGNWEHENWSPLFECLNRIESITKLQRVSDQGLIDDAQAAYTNALLRREKTGACALKAGELATLREVVEVYGSLLKEISHAQFQLACNHTNANMSRVLNQRNGKVIAGVLMENRV
jgi:hypothetical protein